MDDPLVFIHEYAVEEFSNHANQIDPNIRLTNGREQDDKLPLLDTLIDLADDASTNATVYKKPTHTVHYHNFITNHLLQHKLSVIHTLIDQTPHLVTHVAHVKYALTANRYPA